MATVVYQGLQCCLDSQLVESRMLRLKLSTPKHQLPPSFELATKAIVLDSTVKELGERCYPEEISQKANFLHDQQASSNRDPGGWTFFQALYNSSQCPKEPSGKGSMYVHPLVTRSWSRLSEKSLEMCTESLGSETGSDVSENSCLFLSSSAFEEEKSLTSSGRDMGSEVSENSFPVLSSSASKAGNSSTREQQKSCQLLGAKKVESRSFPPPLTTMSGSESLQVRPHREEGRLIIKAIKSPSTRPCFQAERSNGRLRLTLVKDSSVSSSTTIEETREKIFEGNINKTEEIQNDHEYHERAQDEADDFEEQVVDGNDGCFEEMDISDLDVEAERGLEEFQRPSRCKEGELENKRLLHWEPFWVATS